MSPPGAQQLSVEQLRCFPKVLLHDHLDGGVRPETLTELSLRAGLPPLPDAPAGGDLASYLARFRFTVAVMQDAPALRRVARECAEDLAADGVVYAEVRFAPELHTATGLSAEAALEAVLEGFREAEAAVATAGHAVTVRAVTVRTILSAIRTSDQAVATVRLALAYGSHGVVGFDLAGQEGGYPASAHAEAFALARSEGLAVTIHAGEAAGLGSIEDAVAYCHPRRLGHGVRLADAVNTDGDGTVALAPLAKRVLDDGITLEMCPTSNVDTGAVASVADHPVDTLLRHGFKVTINTDNRLMSQTTLSDELAKCAGAFSWGWEEVRALMSNAAQSAFCSKDQRSALAKLLSPGGVA